MSSGLLLFTPNKTSCIFKAKLKSHLVSKDGIVQLNLIFVQVLKSFCREKLRAVQITHENNLNHPLEMVLNLYILYYILYCIIITLLCNYQFVYTNLYKISQVLASQCFLCGSESQESLKISHTSLLSLLPLSFRLTCIYCLFNRVRYVTQIYRPRLSQKDSPSLLCTLISPSLCYWQAVYHIYHVYLGRYDSEAFCTAISHLNIIFCLLRETLALELKVGKIKI